jgi:hypothetical protein
MRGNFDPEAILRVLHRHGVEYVVIGGLAAALRGSPQVTTDIDITPSPALKNLARLSLALRELDARVRVAGVPDGVPFNHDANSLARMQISNLSTVHGDLDISMVPSGTFGFEDLSRDATTIVLRGLEVRVASLVDVIRSKEAAGRPMDALTLPTLRRLAEAPEYLATAELLQNGQVLLSLWTVDGQPIIAPRGRKTTPMEVRCRVRGPDAKSDWRQTRDEADEDRGVMHVRYPEHFEGDVAVPLDPGIYEVEWQQAVFDRKGSKSGVQQLASTGFTVTPDGRFVPQ